MATTKVTSGGITDATIATADIAANAVTASRIADSSVQEAKINNGAVTVHKIGPGSVNSSKIADATIGLDKLVHGTSTNDGKFLRANNGADPTWETVSVPAGTTINNNGDNKVITGSSSSNTLEAESTLTWNGTLLDINQSGTSDTGLKLRNSEGGLYIRANDDKTFFDTDQLIIRKEDETQRLQLDVNGRIGLGNHSGLPNTKVDIGLGVFAATGVDHDASDWGADNVFQLTATGGNAAQNQVLLVGCHSGGVGQIGSGIGFGRNSTTDWGTYLSFKTHPTSTSNIDQLVEHMRINAHGFVKMKGDMANHMSADGNNYHEIQADNPNIQILNMKHGSSNGYGIMMQLNHEKATHWAHRVYNFSNGSTRMYIRADGDLENTNNSYGSTSDVKLKENIVDASSQWNDVKALRVRNFNYKADENKTKFLGLVAQEAETVCPSLVKEQPDTDAENKDLGTTTKFLKYSILYMKAFKALQEAMAKIETLETKVAALEAA